LRWKLSSLVTLALWCGCYTPKGAFITVDDFAATAPREYVIGVGDAISVRVFQHEDMSARVRVRVDGFVSLPLVNEVRAAGKTPPALAHELTARFKDFINTPAVTVMLEETRPLTVSILGEVTRAGVQTLEPGAGVLQALAAAGGLNDFAHPDGIFVVRRVPGEAQPIRIRFTWRALSEGSGKAAGFLLQPGDVVVAE
jgi:polysaccharide biosynthesis/export protein